MDEAMVVDVDAAGRLVSFVAFAVCLQWLASPEGPANLDEAVVLDEGDEEAGRWQCSHECWAAALWQVSVLPAQDRAMPHACARVICNKDSLSAGLGEDERARARVSGCLATGCFAS